MQNSTYHMNTTPTSLVLITGLLLRCILPITLLIIPIQQVVYGQSLTAYKQEAMANNPAIKAMELRLEAHAKQVKEVGALPNTQLTTAYFVSEPETRTGAQKASVSAQQSLPWFGTNKAKRNTLLAENKIYENTLAIQKRKIAYQIEKQYYKIYELKAKQKLLIQQDSLLQQYLDLALVAVETNKATAIEVLKINIARNTLLDQKEILKGTLLSEESTMNQLLHRDGFDPLLIPDNLYMPDEEPTMLLDDITFHPELLTYDYRGEVLEKKEAVNAKEAAPAIGIGLAYTIVEERSNMQFSDNGKDIIMPSLSVSIPLFSKRYKARSDRYELEKEEALALREAAQTQLAAHLEQAINNRITARINYDTQQKNITQTQQVEKMLLSQYETSQVGFESLLEIQEMRFSYQHKKIAAIAEYFLHTATLNYLR